MRADKNVRPVSRRRALLGIAAAGVAGCSRVEFIAANLPTVFGAYTRHADIPYGSDPRQRLDVYLPDKPPATDKTMVVFWYGGRWTTGDKSQYRFVGAALAELGYVAVLPNYRHYPDVKLPGFMDDAARAALWATMHAGGYGVDPGRVYVMGHSAGAHIAGSGYALFCSYRTSRTGDRRCHRPVGTVRLSAAARCGCARHVRAARQLPCFAADKLRALRCAADAAGAWLAGRHGVAEKFPQPRHRLGCAGCRCRLEAVSPMRPCGYGGCIEPAGARPGANACRSCRFPQPARVILKIPCALPLSKRRSSRVSPSGLAMRSREMNS